MRSPWVSCGLADGVTSLLSPACADWVTNAALGVPTAINDASLLVAVRMDRVIPSLPTGPIKAPSRACFHFASPERVRVSEREGGSYCGMLITVTKGQFLSLPRLCAQQSRCHACFVNL